MNKFILLFVLLSLFVSLTNEITCIVCDGELSSARNDPFNSTSASYIILSGYTYCQKKVFVNGRIVRAGDTTCITSDVQGITNIYCCSNEDLCNITNKLPSSLLMTISN